MPTIKNVFEEITSVKKILLGNGDIGLCEQVRNNSDAVKSIIQKPDKTGKWIIRIIMTIIAIGQFVIAYKLIAK